MSWNPAVLNPINLSEGGVEIITPYSAELMRAVPRMYGPITSLYHDPLPYPGPVGPAPIVFTPRATLPYIQDSWPGPIHLGPPADK